MPKDKINVRLGEELIIEIEAYAEEHELGRADVIRLAVINQLKRKPPKTLPEGVSRVGRNPNAADAGRLGAEARWKKSTEEVKGES